MTTLRTFQTEIEEIHNREMAKQSARIVTSPVEKETMDQKLATITQAKNKYNGTPISTKSAVGVGPTRASLLEDKILV